MDDRFWKNWPLAVKLALASTVSVVAVVASITYLSILREQQAFRLDMKERAEVLVESLAVSASDKLYKLDSHGLVDISTRLLSKHTVDSVRFYSPEGRLLADNRDRVRNLAVNDFGRRLAESREIIFEWQPDYLLAGSAVHAGAEILGAVSIGLSTAPLNVKIRGMRNQGIIIALITVFAGTLLAVFISRSITEPINALARLSKNIAAGNLTEKIMVSGSNEVAALALAFNDMTGALRAAHNELEMRVQKRTAELAETTGRLQIEVKERKQAQDELQQAFVNLKKAQNELIRVERLAVVGETSGRVAHEILNPMTSILSRVEHNMDHWKAFNEIVESLKEIISDWHNEFLQGSFTDYLNQKSEHGVSYGREDFDLLISLMNNAEVFRQQRSDDLLFIHKQINRIIKIVNSLRESARSQRSVAKVSIAKIVKEAIELQDDAFKKRRIEVTTSIPPDAPAILADEIELIQVFTNMFRNSMQSIESKMRLGGRISVATSVAGTALEIRLKDNGSGIPDTVRHSLFNFNFTTKPKEQGTGLGLGICRRFVRECGGDLLLEESIEGVGATFLIKFPIAH